MININLFMSFSSFFAFFIFCCFWLKSNYYANPVLQEKLRINFKENYFVSISSIILTASALGGYFFETTKPTIIATANEGASTSSATK